jgi:hypothetical protein
MGDQYIMIHHLREGDTVIVHVDSFTANYRVGYPAGIAPIQLPVGLIPGPRDFGGGTVIVTDKHGAIIDATIPRPEELSPTFIDLNVNSGQGKTTYQIHWDAYGAPPADHSMPDPSVLDQVSPPVNLPSLQGSDDATTLQPTDGQLDES